MLDTMKFLGVVLVVLITNHAAEANVTLHKIEDCDPKGDYKIKINFKLADSEDSQVIEEGTFTTPIELGDNIVDVADIYTLQDEQYVHLLTLNDTFCKIMDKVMGEFFNDMQNAAGIKAGTCPMPPGEYKVNNHKLDFDKLKFKDIPEGRFKVEVKLKDAPTSDILNCHIIEFTKE